jgi:DNA-binding YbaB/EbfC family protein
MTIVVVAGLSLALESLFLEPAPPDMMLVRAAKGYPMKDLGALMKQAQAMQQQLTEAQARLAETTADGASGGGMVALTLKGSGELVRVTIDEALLKPGEGEIVADLIIAAHAEAKKKLDAAQADAMRTIAGPLAGLPGFPGIA